MPGMDHEAINEGCARALLAWLDQQSGNQVRETVNLSGNPSGPTTSADAADGDSPSAGDSAAASG
jgi:hypothetical protein